VERDVGELNPDEAMIAWVLCQLPGGASPERVEIEWMRGERPIELVARVDVPLSTIAQ